MRPVNLIPKDERRGDRAAMRTGVASYVLLGALAMGVLAVAVLALTSKQISDHKAEIAAAAAAGAGRPWPRLRASSRSRLPERLRRLARGTITSLAQSRFDWQRVLNEFARVIPSNVWLIKLAGTVDPTVSVTDGPGPPDARRGAWPRPRDGGLRVQPGCRRRPDRESPGDRRRHPGRPGVLGAARSDPGQPAAAPTTSDSNATHNGLPHPRLHHPVQDPGRV